METAVPGIHDAILLCIGIAGVYLVVAALQLTQMKRRVSVAPVGKEPSVASRLPVEQNGAATAPLTFASQLERSGVEAELRRLKKTVSRLQAEINATQCELKRLRDSRSTVPLYSEAMHLAQQGLETALIAARCNISRSEAELVVSLARKERQSKGAAVAVERTPAMNANDERQQSYRAAA